MKKMSTPGRELVVCQLQASTTSELLKTNIFLKKNRDFPKRGQPQSIILPVIVVSDTRRYLRTNSYTNKKAKRILEE